MIYLGFLLLKATKTVMEEIALCISLPAKLSLKFFKGKLGSLLEVENKQREEEQFIIWFVSGEETGFQNWVYNNVGPL